ncbi:hypothetical protein ACFLZ0_03240, partial [Patescibacteria group bacterium]
MAIRETRAQTTETIGLVRQDCAGYTNCFTSLSAWEANYGGIDFGACEVGDLVCADTIAIAQIDGSWSSADTTAVTIDGWTTDATHYIKVYTTATARHNGIYTGDGGKSTAYRLVLSNTKALDIREGNTRIDGLQIEITSASSNSQDPITFANGSFVAGDRSDISNCILKGHGNASYYEFGIRSGNNLTRNTWNTIIYNIPLSANSVGIDARYLDYIYNCT